MPFHSCFSVTQTAHQIYLKLKGDSISLSRNNDIFCMSVSSSLHCDDKLLPETPKKDLYHVGVSITIPRGLLSNSHASHVPHFHHLQLSRGFQMPIATSSLQSRVFSLFPGRCQHGHVVHPAHQNTAFSLGSISAPSHHQPEG